MVDRALVDSLRLIDKRRRVPGSAVRRAGGLLVEDQPFHHHERRGAKLLQTADSPELRLAGGQHRGRLRLEDRGAGHHREASGEIVGPGGEEGGEVANNGSRPEKDRGGGQRPRRALRRVTVDRNGLPDAQRRGVKGEARLIQYWVRDVEHGSAREVDCRRSVFREQAASRSMGFTFIIGFGQGTLERPTTHSHEGEEPAGDGDALL